MTNSMNMMQALMESMNATEQKRRAESGQLTLGSLINALERTSADLTVKGFGELHSYRGYYSDLAFTPATSRITAGELLERCKAAMGRVFQGYKGGDFLMGENTPLWISDYGTASGMRLMGIRADEDLVIIPVTEAEESQW